jgi:K319L-like, PKD domain
MKAQTRIMAWRDCGFTAMLKVCLVAWLISAGIVNAGDIQVISKDAVANSSMWETKPSLAADAQGSYVSYTGQSLIGTVLGYGDIYTQYLKGSAAFGPPSLISDGMTDDQINDSDGSHTVYTAFDGTGLGQIMLYDHSSGTTIPLSPAESVRGAKIWGNAVAWVTGVAGATTATYWDLRWDGTGLTPVSIAGPTPPVSNLAIGAKYVVWDERVGTNRDVFAYVISTGARVAVADDPALIERLPVTSGDWVVWESMAVSAVNNGPTALMARNLATNELRTVVNDGFLNLDPSIDGDYITYESNKDGDFDLYLYRISDSKTFQLTNDPADQFLSDVHGNRVAYVDDQTGGLDVYVVRFTDQLPIANAGPDQTAHAGTTITLSGSASYDPNGYSITSYAWSVVSRPDGSTAAPATPDAVMTSFTPDLPGDYVLGLVVTNQNGVTSQADTVTVSTGNTAPVADAGPDQALTQLGSLVTLDGSASYDVDGDTIIYQWKLFPPPGSKTVLQTNKTSPIATFVADVQGEYTAVLVVADPWSSSADDRMLVSFTNLPPVANAGTNLTIDIGNTATLDGSGSSDPNGDRLTYRWGLVSSPAGSTAILGTPNSVTATLSPDIAGSYVASLVVNDGFVDSTPSNVTVVAIAQATQATQQTSLAMNAINSLSLSVFKNTNLQNALTNKIQAVLADIQAGLYADALSKLQNDVLKKTDGCANGGAPDANDWIKDCGSQAQVYPILQQAIVLLQSLI